MPVPVEPEVIVRKLALLAAVQVQVEAAVTGNVPVEAPPLTLVVAVPSVTAHDEDVDVDVDEGVESLFEQAGAHATAAATAETSRRRGSLISQPF